MSSFLDFTRFSLVINIALFVAAAIVVWMAGTRISRYADLIGISTGLGGAVLGVVLLGFVTSLPEAAVTVTSAYVGNAPLAINNLLGGVAMQVAILAIADAAIGRSALTSVVASPGVLLQGSLGIVMLVVVAAGTVVAGTSVFGVGLWSWLLLVLYVVAVWMIVRGKGRKPWLPSERVKAFDPTIRRGSQTDDDQVKDEKPLAGTLAKTAIAALVILLAGFLLSRTGEAIAEQTGLGSSFVGAVLVAISTSLPEVSTVLEAVKLRRYEMAISGILGTNLFDLVLVFVVDLVYVGGPVLAEVGRFSTFGALLGIAVTALFIIGLVERRDRTVFRMGYDSLAVLLVYVGGVLLLFRLA